MDGRKLWEINLGKNIREGAHYTQFMVYDLDGDGKAELVCKTADGTIDGTGKVIRDANADHRNPAGYILSGPEFLTVFNGETGAAMSTVKYVPGRHPATENPTVAELKAEWGDGYGNRCDRFLACVAYLDGRHPSVVMCRGYYTRSVLAAWDWQNGKLTSRWVFDTSDPKNAKFAGQGNHNLTVADVDGDGKDEIVYGAMAVDDDGRGLWSSGLGHGDAQHVSDLDPAHPGLEIFGIQERFDDAGAHMLDARTGKVLWKKPSLEAGRDGEGPGRGLAADIDPRYPGSECWAFGAGVTGLFDARGNLITKNNPRTCNFAIWWDGDLLRELLDRNTISKWDWRQSRLVPLLTAAECDSNNGTKATPVLSADLFGDWREEVIWRTKDGKALHIYTTTIPTKYRMPSLMEDPQYRLSVAWQNVGYNQPPHPDFRLGEAAGSVGTKKDR
jgi:rhamnogalacturonan endolyase